MSIKSIAVASALIIASFGAKAQIISGDIGFAANATPTFFFSPVINAQHHLKNGDYIGMGILTDWARDRETYVARYGTDINKRWYFNSGIGFVNDWSVKYPDGSHRTFRTYIVGVDYVFKRITPNNPGNFYVGFDFTDEKLYAKAGIRFGHEKRRK